MSFVELIPPNRLDSSKIFILLDFNFLIRSIIQKKNYKVCTWISSSSCNLPFHACSPFESFAFCECASVCASIRICIWFVSMRFKIEHHEFVYAMIVIQNEICVKSSDCNQYYRLYMLKFIVDDDKKNDANFRLKLWIQQFHDCFFSMQSNIYSCTNAVFSRFYFLYVNLVQ